MTQATDSSCRRTPLAAGAAGLSTTSPPVVVAAVPHAEPSPPGEAPS